MRNIIITTAVILSSFLTGCQQTKEPTCKFTKIKTLYTSLASDENGLRTYTHTVLLNDFSRKCLDSTKMVDITMKYLDTVSVYKPVDVIRFYYSDKDFIPGDSQVIQETDKSRLFSVYFEKGAIQDFSFTDENGDFIYIGPRWVPEGSSEWYK